MRSSKAGATSALAAYTVATSFESLPCAVVQEAKRANDRVMAPEVVALRGKKEMRVAHCLGSSEQPMSDRQLEDKFRSQCQAVLGKQRTEAALEMLARLDEVQDLRIAASALVP